MEREYIEEGRASLVNALVAYGIGFNLLDEDKVDQDLLEEISEFCESFEAIVPMFVSMYEATKKISGNPDLTFMEWIQTLGQSKGYGLGGLF